MGELSITPDYQVASRTYDEGRPITDAGLEFALKFISKAVGPRKDDVRYLDLGCGTGRFAIPVATKLGYTVTGADRSQGMLEKAQEKENSEKVNWIIQDATNLDIPFNSFDVVFMSHLLHHIKDPQVVLREVYRILRPGGVIINRYGALEDIEGDPEHRFFPGVLEVDRARNQGKQTIENWLRAAGFVSVETQTVDQPTFPNAQERLRRVSLKMTSALHLIDDTDFKKGLRRFRSYIKTHPEEDWILRDPITYTSAVSSKRAV